MYFVNENTLYPFCFSLGFGHGIKGILTERFSYIFYHFSVDVTVKLYFNFKL